MASDSKGIIPQGVHIVALIFLVYGIAMLLFALVMGSAVLRSVLGNTFFEQLLPIQPSGGIALLGTFGALWMAAWGFIGLIVARGLWQGKRWAWILGIIYVGSKILRELMLVVRPPGEGNRTIWFIVLVIFFTYFTFSKSVRTFFASGT